MYLLDSNVFIEAKNVYYGFDIAPGFWNFLTEAHLQGTVGSVPTVKQELLAQSDELSDWARAAPDSFWVEETQQTIDAFRALATWTMRAPRFISTARTDFLASADFRLIAEAMAGPHVVVTRETSAPLSQKRIKIPDVCLAHTVSFVDPFSAFRDLGLELH